jgi:hypothetical protein
MESPKNEQCLFTRYNKLCRLANNVDKALKRLGGQIDLSTADFDTLKRYVSLVSIERTLDESVESYRRPARRWFAIAINNKIKEHKPTVVGHLDRMRLFGLFYTNWDGTQKTHMMQNFKKTFPHCFVSGDWRQDKILKIMDFTGQTVPHKKRPILDKLIECKIICSMLFINFVAGVIFGCTYKNGLLMMNL